MAVSAFATGLTAIKLRVRWKAIDISSVRFLFFVFYVYLCVWSSARAVYYVWMSSLQRSDTLQNEKTSAQLTNSEIDRLGVHGILYLQDEARKNWVAALICIGDAGLFGASLVIYALAYELFRIACRTMDRGVARERVKIRTYCWVIHSLLLLFVFIEAIFVLVFKGYTEYTHSCLLACFVIQVLSTAYMAALLVALKARGRENELIHGELVRSPVYMRLKHIMMVYVLFTSQFQLSSLIFYVTQHRTSALTQYMGASLLTLNATGLALSVTTCFSQACVLAICQCCLPHEVQAQLVVQGNLDVDPRIDPPPQQQPVFVVTDIESSSALWAIDNGHLMQQATEIHDGILRALLIKYRGYEITTCGDSFQLAFHTIHEAVDYCLAVQLDLLLAKWPEQLHNIVSATKKQRSGVRKIFRGLRVRMGVHDAALSDGDLVCDTHAVTGNLTYTGASKLIVDEISDIGNGGQILITQRVADWLLHHEDQVSIRFVMRHVKEYAIPHVSAHLELYQVVPRTLQARLRYFPLPRAYQAGNQSLSRGFGSFRTGAAGANADLASLMEWRIGYSNSNALRAAARIDEEEEDEHVDGDHIVQVSPDESCELDQQYAALRTPC